jgi:hypothetical protein
MNAVVEVTALQIRLSRRDNGMPDMLLGTDRILKRWAVSIGDGTEDFAWMEIAKSRYPQLDDQMAIVVDQLVLRAPRHDRRVVELWYRRPDDDLADIARALNVRRAAVKAHWQTSLGYFRARFLESPLSRLREMAATHPTTGRMNLAT